ncbi:DsbA family oxidoreductase [Herbiconiux sp. SYSU D00978]|uniref:DsbA family oxidoreductase n=1 Tax=Herbiconiux sp. SYSU D00978 TaxID=2812562 RepID=UPI001A971973|nr:DsbA family oxidoreductase [Herbiconiux sp. SYSU D00978]
MTPIKVDIWSDIACPWCYIGKRKFEAGVAAYGGEVEVEYHSFELSPDTPVDFDGSAADFLSGYKGLPLAQVEQMIERVVTIARSVGLDYDYDALRQTNTVKAHELLHFAKTHGKQLEMKGRLLRAYFIEGGHVGRVEDLADLAAEIGLDRAEALAALTEERHLADVREDQKTARDLGINGVPFFVFEGRFGVSGAQEAATFANVLQQVAAQRDEVVPAGADA